MFVLGDLEANGFLQVADKVHCGVFIDVKTKKMYKFYQGSHINYVQAMLDFMDSCDVIGFHNGYGYDFPLLRKLYGYEYKGKKIDTLLMSRLLKPDRRLPRNCPDKSIRPHSIEAWGYRVGRGKPDHDDWSVFSEEMLHRCSEDVEILLLTYHELMQEANEIGGWKNAFKLTFNLFEILQRQEEYGWKVDREYMEHCIKLLTHWIDRIDRIITPYLPNVLVIDEAKVKGEVGYVKKPFLKSGEYSAVTKRFLSSCGIHESSRIVAGCFSRISFRKTDLNSNMEVKDYLLKAGWIPDKWNYKKDENGRPTGERSSPKLSHDDPFNGVKGGVGRLIARRVQCRHRRSNIEGWLELIRDDGRIASRVSGMATTGRMKHAGIVNVPNGEAFFGKQMRRVFIADKDKVLIGCDSAGCQNRMLAARVGDPSFTKTLIEGKKEDKTSIHHVNQRAIKEVAGYDVSYGQAKTLNYAFMFGASDGKLGTTIGKGKEEGAKIREALLSVSAGFSKLVENLTKEWRSNAKVGVNPWGGKRYYNGWVRGLDGRPIYIESEHQILVYVLQSDEAIFMSAAYVLLYKRLNKLGFKWGEDYGIVCFYHDEYTIECRKEIANQIAKVAEQCIVDAGKFYKIDCPHQGEAEIGNNWMEIH